MSEINIGGIHFKSSTDSSREDQEVDLERRLNVLPNDVVRGTGHARISLTSDSGVPAVKFGGFPREGYVVRELNIPDTATNAHLNLAADSAQFDYQGTRYMFESLGRR